ncbi:WD40-repeat-containing domain protein [Suillus fuscotomentosus]|uniref:WD40-repeat-containing domain protein n=1 Tax=Suillus fuscotomentosus TaxID=1912939 RepID=A0AAD4DRE0_9AGAM|nr:WD40-repeat-containing domain protein [Suillus fuscotomentosus]KAG1890691.1 WD40-repeat-containing domain protein [Suillus fuscotomentosus]
MSSSTSTTAVVTPRHTMQGHARQVNSAVHLPDGRHIITCSSDGSLRLWDLESGAQIGEDWRDEDNVVFRSMSLSPNGKTIASGDYDGKVRLWDVETRKVIARWTGHAHTVQSLCWSADDKRMASGSWDGTARVWDVKKGKTVLKIETSHARVNTVMYSPDSSKLATGGYEENAVKIWDTKTGKRLKTLKHSNTVRSLAWTSLDGNGKLISDSYDQIRIYDTATWEQIAILEGHTKHVTALSLSQNNRLLASASYDKTARLWNVDTNLPVGPPLQHENVLWSVALSPDAKVLVIAEDTTAYTWDVHAILKEAGLEDILSIGSNIVTAPEERQEQEQTPPQDDDSGPRSSLSDRSFLELDATRCPGQFDDIDELPPMFFHGMEAPQSSPMDDLRPHSSANAFLARLLSLLHRFRPDNDGTTELPQPSRPLAVHLRTLLARLSSLIHRFSPESDAPNELQQPSTPSRLDPHVLLARLSSLFSRSRLSTDEEGEHHLTLPTSSHSDARLIGRLSLFFRSQPHTNEEAEHHPTVASSSRPYARLVSRLSSLFRSQPHTNGQTELPQRPSRPRVVDVAAVRDKQSLVVARGPNFKKAKRAYEERTKSHAQAQASSSGTQPAHASTLATSPVPGTNTTTIGAATPQSPPIPWWSQIVLFLCCASPPPANSH